MNLFYSPHIEGDTFLLDEHESKHAVRVLRLGIGDPVILVNGKGGWFEATIEEDHPKRCLLKIQSVKSDFQPLPYQLHMAVSPTKNLDRFEWFLEKSTEIGITEITPLMCHRTERKNVNMNRFEKILISAMKQSLKAYKPILNNPIHFGDFLKNNNTGTKAIAHCLPDDRRGLTQLDRDNQFTLLVGPEGDFTQEEVDLSMKADFIPLHLGQSRLRTETAAVYLCIAMQLLHDL